MAGGKAKAWTDAEKAQVLFSMIDINGPINWSKVFIPEGRTQKAVMHMIANEKARHGISPNKGGSKSAQQGDDATPSKKQKTTKEPKKSKASEKAASKRKRDSDEDSGNEMDVGRHVEPEEALSLPQFPSHDKSQEEALDTIHVAGNKTEQRAGNPVKEELSDPAYETRDVEVKDEV